MPSPHQGGTSPSSPRAIEAMAPPPQATPPLTPLSLSLLLPPHPSPPYAQVSRALRIKSEYLSKTAGDLETKRQQAEQDADSGILGLGLLRQEQEKREENVHVVVVVKEETAKQGADKAEEVREEKARLV